MDDRNHAMTLLEDVATCRVELRRARVDGDASQLALAKTDDLLSKHELQGLDLEWILKRVKAAAADDRPEFFKFEANWTYNMLGGWVVLVEDGDVVVRSN